MKKNFSLIISDEAYLDIADTFTWYDAIEEPLGKKFIISFESSLNTLLNNPLSYHVRYKNVRIIFMKRFPYGIHYVIDGNILKVIAVFHTSRNPQNWEDRL